MKEWKKRLRCFESEFDRSFMIIRDEKNQLIVEFILIPFIAPENIPCEPRRKVGILDGTCNTLASDIFPLNMKMSMIFNRARSNCGFQNLFFRRKREDINNYTTEEEGLVYF